MNRKPNKCTDCGEPCSYGCLRCYSCARAFAYGRRLMLESRRCPVCDVKITPFARHCKKHGHSGLPVLDPAVWVSAATEEARALKLKLSAVLAGDRDRFHVLARTRAWVKLRAQGYPLTAIGKASGFDHTTVMNGERRISALEEWYAACRPRVGRPPKPREPEIIIKNPVEWLVKPAREVRP